MASILDGIKSMAQEATTLSGWALAILGGSILIIVSSSYIRPISKRVRLIYLLFIPGWALFVISMYCGDSINRNLISAVIAGENSKQLMTIGSDVNTAFGSQIDTFRCGVLIFVLWLVIYLCWWVFGSWQIPQDKPQ